MSSGETKSFSQLQSLINTNLDSISLDCDYRYDAYDNPNGIFINRTLTITGNGHTIDAIGKSKVFNVSKTSTLTLNNLNIINAYSETDGGAIYSEGNLTVSDCQFSNNNILHGDYVHYLNVFNYLKGGAIFCNGSSSFRNCDFISNIAECGGAIWSNSSISVSNCRFLSNKAIGGEDYEASCQGETHYVGGEGAAIYSNGEINLTDSVFSFNVANLTEAKGPAVLYLNSKSQVSNCNFSNNDMDAVIYWCGSGSIENSSFINNVAYDCGGAIFLAGNATVSNSVFINNSGAIYGGAIYSVGQYDYDEHTDIYTRYDTDISISDCIFKDNLAYVDGGALYMIANATVKNCNFTDNIADVAELRKKIEEEGYDPDWIYDLSTAGKGGAIYAENGTVDSCNFINNHGIYCGGAIYSNGSVILSNSNFQSNYADIQGDNIYNVADLELINNTMNSNRATIFNNNFNYNGKITSPVDLVVLDNRTFYYKSLNNFRIYARLIDDNGNLIEDKSIYFTIDSFDQLALFNNQTSCFEYILASVDNNQTIYAKYQGASNLNLKTATILIVDHIPTLIELTNSIDKDSNLSFQYGKVGIGINLKDYNGESIDGTVNVTVYNSNSISVYCEKISIPNGFYQLNLNDLPISNYSINISYDGNEDYLSSNISKEFEVGKIRENIIIKAENITFHEDLKVDMMLANINSTLSISITDLDLNPIEIDGVDLSKIELKNGKASIKIPKLKMGNYILTASFLGNDLYEAVSNSINFTVTDLIKSSLSLSAKNIDYGDTASIVIQLVDANSNKINGTVNLNINNKAYRISLLDGLATFTISNLNSGDYSLSATYAGDKRYLESSAQCSFKVNPIQTVIDSSNMNAIAVNAKVDGKSGKYYSFTLRDSRNNPLANKAVMIVFNNNVYQRITDSNGMVKLQINLANAGTYSIVMSFLGDSNYQSTSKVSKIIVKKQSVKLTAYKKSFKIKSKSKYLMAKLLSSKNKPIKGKVLIFTFNKKSYNVKTNAKGIAKLKVKVKVKSKKTFKYKVRFKGDKTYYAKTKSAKLVIK